MGLHPRLGKYSPLLALQHDILQAICARLAASQLKSTSSSTHRSSGCKLDNGRAHVRLWLRAAAFAAAASLPNFRRLAILRLLRQKTHHLLQLPVATATPQWIDLAEAL
jgi:hypothetical protein